MTMGIADWTEPTEIADVDVGSLYDARILIEGLGGPAWRTSEDMDFDVMLEELRGIAQGADEDHDRRRAREILKDILEPPGQGVEDEPSFHGEEG